ncbi:MAG: hypothetical protein IJP29_03385 [Lachnospiraceae bacterium]|nr:hypothetical protein [Lachnospiraceae bacterium]
MFGRREKKCADYLFVERKQGKGKMQLEWGACCGKKILRLTQYMKDKEPRDRDNKRMEKMIQSHCRKDTILYGDEQMVREFGLSNVLFEARKIEFLRCVEELAMLFRGERNKKCRSAKEQVRRKQFLLVVDSEEWKYKELVQIISAVKNVYEDVYILPLVSLPYIDEMREFFCEEYGMLLHVTLEAEIVKKRMDGVFFLLEHWDKRYMHFLYEKGYVVCEWEHGLRRVRKAMGREKMQEERKYTGALYGGFVYHLGKIQLSYELAILLQMQRMTGFVGKQEEENPISIVAIYGVE